jgi:hypothetical protein
MDKSMKNKQHKYEEAIARNLRVALSVSVKGMSIAKLKLEIGIRDGDTRFDEQLTAAINGK